MNAQIAESLMTPDRKPIEASSPHLGRLAKLPIFLELNGKRVLVAGNGNAVVWKTELLSAAGAGVDVYTEAPSQQLIDLAMHGPGGSITIHRRGWHEADVIGAAIAIGAFDNDEDAARFAAVARTSGVPVNVVDKPAYCDFAFGSIVNRSPLVIGISTNGGAPVFAKAIRAKLEALIPYGFARWAAVAREWRSRIHLLDLPFAGRRRFWESFTDRAMTAPNHDPDESDFSTFLSETRNDAASWQAGLVTLVGAGPGDPELLTLRAVRALQSADVILFDDLISAAILDFARREAKKMLVGKTGHGPSCKQHDINALMIGLARRGKRVVRLKGGDPMIFGRGGEEIEACRQAGIAVRVVPGITAAQGAASTLMISLTHRDHAHRLQFITGHEKNGKLPRDIEWRSLIDPKVTTAIYMPAKTLGDLATKAIQQGLDPLTPAVAITGATRPEVGMIATSIANLSKELAVSTLRGPLLVLIGKVFAEKVPNHWPKQAVA